MPDFDRPTLPPLAYRLRIAHAGLYVRETSRNNRRIITTVNPHDALRLPEAQALRVAGNLRSRTGHVIRLDPVQPGQARDAA